MENKQKITLANLSESVDRLIKSMSLKEKVGIMSGRATVERMQSSMGSGEDMGSGYCDIPCTSGKVNELDFVPVRFTDGPRGVVSGNCTAFPASMCRGASFDMDLEKRIGKAIGYESRARGANYFGGVCMNILRHPAGGRAQETYSEDMFHLGRMAGQLVEGVQYHNVAACIKHYAVNNIENTRLYVNVELDDRTLHEVYLPHFKYCIKEKKAVSVMGAYNKLRNDHCCESKLLLTDILRDEWGFEGFTISDFTLGVHNAVKAANAGMDIEMPVQVHYVANLEKAVADGEVKEETIDESVRRILNTMLRLELSNDPSASYERKNICADEHIQLAKEAAHKGTVLLKNEENILPLNKGNMNKIALVGNLADGDITGDHGSSWVNPPYITSIKQGLANQLDNTAIELVTSFDNEDTMAAQSAAKDADVVIVVAGSTYADEGEALGVHSDGAAEFMANTIKEIQASIGIDPTAIFSLGTSETRGGDRKSIRLKPEEIKLIKEVAKVNKNVVLITFAGAAIIYEDILEDTKAIVMGWFAGMEGGNAISDILFGKVNPSGKTPCTFAKDESDYVESGIGPAEVFYDYYHGYMKADKEGVQPRYPFGFGLSYTTYEYANEKAVVNGDKITASFDVSNTGDCNGEEIVQVYVGKVASAVDRPVKTLQGFKRIAVRAGETVSDSIDINIEDLKYYDESTSSWVLEQGEYNIYIGKSSAAEDLVCIRVTV